jgi:hypothetical protein
VFADAAASLRETGSPTLAWLYQEHAPAPT